MSDRKIIKVFPRKTRATPEGDDVRINCEPGLFDQADDVHISVTFTYDKPRAEYLAETWQKIAPVQIGGPAYNAPGGDFIPGQYLKRGYVITSRGCPNRCWFCPVWKREGREVRELPITDGWLVQDDNLLACSDDHIRGVFAMLDRQVMPVQFTGGLEAARLKDWHVKLLEQLRPKQIFFAYDTPDDYEPLREATEMLWIGGIKPAPRSYCVRAYVLIGYPKDTFEKAEERLIQTVKLGVMPMAMLWKNDQGETDRNWRKLQRQWARPGIIHHHMKNITA